MKGFSLLEVMVCVFVSAIGLCGLLEASLKSIHSVNAAVLMAYERI